MSEREFEPHLLQLMVVRVVASTTLLIAAFVVELIFLPVLSLYPLFLLTAAIYILSAAYGIAYPWLRDSRAFVYLQVLGDLAVTTVFVYISGGAESSFSFLYVLSVVVGAMFLGRRGALLTASLSWILYSGMVVLLMYGWLEGYPARLDPFSETEKLRVYYSVAVHFVGFYCAALAMSYLAERHRLTGRELERHRFELAALQALNSDILRSIHSGILATDLHGRVRFINPPGAEILGRTQEELRGANLCDLLDEDPGFLEQLRGQIEDRRRLRYEKDYNNALGQRLTLGFSASLLLNPEGQPEGFIFSFQDLSDVRALADEVKIKDRMAVLGEMAAGLAHELRNPLASMTGSVQVLRSDLDLKGEQSSLMDIILKESQRLERTIRDFLLFAKPGQFHPQPTDLGILLKETAALLRNSREFRTSHSLECDIDPQAARCTADPNLIKQVIWNLATNALKAMPDGGCLRMTVQGSKTGGRELVFRDQGVGMTPEQVQSCFRPFQGSFRGGTGLGLAIVYRAVQEHGGTVRVRSVPGCGTEICINLPAIAVPAPALAMTAQE
ncbi:MAG: ATP-binding protein [Acidobacteria bacterium]|nr:ATP-binding protein [Acidobacteriota bacterium]